MNISMAVMFTGLFVFGLAAWRDQLLPRVNVYAVLAGFWWPFIVIDAYVIPQGIRSYFGPEIPFWFTLTIFLLIGIPLALLGYVLQSDAQMADPAGVTISADRRS